jgi:hypothetical protein
MSWRVMFRPGMRAYFVPLAAGIALAASAFLPWVVVDEISLPGFPDIPALWVIGLGSLAAVLAALSLITRKNSRHPLLVVGLAALGVTFLSSRIIPRNIESRALTRSQAVAIVEHRPMGADPQVATGIGLHLGLVASCVIVAFGLTIIVKRSSAYTVTDPNDDV